MTYNEFYELIEDLEKGEATREQQRRAAELLEKILAEKKESS